MGINVDWLFVHWDQIPHPDNVEAFSESVWNATSIYNGYHEGIAPTWCEMYPASWTLQAWKAAFHTGERYGRMRDDIPAAVQADWDTFCSTLFWIGEECDGPYAYDLGVEVMAINKGPLLIALVPEHIDSLIRLHDMRLDLEVFRVPFAEIWSEGYPGNWASTYDEFCAYIEEYVQMLRAAQRRGMGILGVQT